MSSPTSLPPPESVAPRVAPPPATDLPAFTLAFLHAYEAPCPVCGYNLHALLTPRCPECGNPITLRLIAPDISTRPWLVAMVFSSASASVGLFFAYIVISQGWQSLGNAYIKVPVVLYLLSIPVPILLLIFRGLFSRSHPTIQTLTALVIVTLSAVALFIVLLGIGR